MTNTDQEIITSRNPPNVVIERPNSTSPEIHPVNGNYGPDDEEDDEEEDLILGDDDEASGDEEEFDVELDEDIDLSKMDDDDLVIYPDEEDDEDDDL